MHGSIILRIAAVHLMATAVQQTNMGEPHVAIRYPNDKAARETKLGDRVATLQALAEIPAATLAAAETRAAV